MAFNTAEYWAFFVIVLFVSAALRGHPRARVWFLTAASFYFYYASNNYLTLLIIGGTFFDFMAASKIAASTSNVARKRWLIASITSNLLILSTFKYLHLFLSTAVHAINAAGHAVQVPTINLLLPVGISFYTFEAISYVADVYRHQFTARKRWLDFNYFIVFFPKLTAGPIIRPHSFFPHIDKPYSIAEHKFEGYLQMIFLGLFQKVVLADTMAPIADAVYGRLTATDSVTTLIGVYAFSLQIYFDFVGYTNIAIGSAGLLGVPLPENFQRPYIATCVSDFWRRWHISLSTWLRDYLYIPLGGGRGSLFMICRNLMITMTLGGLWHGASWSFAIWGALNGLLLCIERVLQLEAKIQSGFVRGGIVLRLGWSILTFHLFTLLWVPFRARSFDDFVWVFKRLFSFTGPAEVKFEALVVCGLAFATIALCIIDERFDLLGRSARLHPLIKAPVFAAIIVVAVAFSKGGSQPFIYFRF
jgi:alginate O-acetyltransferase complex protein AlgI